MAKIKILVFLLFSIAYCLVPGALLAQTDSGWEISQFHSDITLNPDTSVRVVETLNVDFNNLQKHGIFRSIPVKYQTKLGTNLNIRLEVNNIHNGSGQSHKFSTSREGNLLKLKIGDPDKTITGKNTYVIDYSVSQVITHPNEQAEFYWNITGNDWPVVIKEASTRITSPDQSILDSICFTGYFGSQFQDCVTLKEGNSVLAGSNIPLEPGEGFTVAVSLDPSKFTFPTPAQKFLLVLRDNWPLGIPFITLIVMLRLYWLHGRDREFKNIFHEGGEIRSVSLFQKLNPPTIYGPPSNILPGEAGTLVDETVHLQDITATIIDLARKGYILIKEIPKKGLFGKPDFIFTYQDNPDANLVSFEHSVLNFLFGPHREHSPAVLSQFKKRTDTQTGLSKAKEDLYDFVVKQGHFFTNPNNSRIVWFVSGFAVIVFGISLLAGLGAAWIIASVVSGLIIIGFAPFMPARTAKGRKTLMDVVGLKEWIELGAWRERIHEKHNFFEEVLPFAIAFGLADKFIKAFTDAELKEYARGMTWYQGRSSNFTNSFANLSSSINSSVVSVSSASRGGSGFSGGGSGGGFGGGGGGSW